jgi:hypothetical protein
MIVRMSFTYKSVPIEIELEQGIDFHAGRQFDPRPLATILDSCMKLVDLCVKT